MQYKKKENLEKMMWGKMKKRWVPNRWGVAEIRERAEQSSDNIYNSAHVTSCILFSYYAFPKASHYEWMIHCRLWDKFFISYINFFIIFLFFYFKFYVSVRVSQVLTTCFSIHPLFMLGFSNSSLLVFFSSHFFFIILKLLSQLTPSSRWSWLCFSCV